MSQLASRPAYARTLQRSDRTALWSIATRIDYLLLLTTLALAVFGVVMIYSVTRPALLARGASPTHYLDQQAIWVALGIAAMAVIVRFHYRLYERWATLSYVVMVLALLVVLSPIGSSTLGGQRWISVGPFDFQPSAFGALSLVLAMAAYCQRHRNSEIGVKQLVKLLVIMGPTIFLVEKQPDLGTAIVMGITLLAILVVAGVQGRWIAALIALLVAVVVLVIQLGVLHKYQMQRLTSFLSQGQNPYSATHYNLTQAKTAISAGGITGEGLFKGMMTNLGFVPEQQTDFIFTAIGEQLGFIGAAATLVCYSLIAWRTWRTAALARDIFGKVICVGVLTMIVFSVFQNIGMVIGIMPITGIPLPFLSYGGSATIAYFVAIGLVLNVSLRRHGGLPAPRDLPTNRTRSR